MLVVASVEVASVASVVAEVSLIFFPPGVLVTASTDSDTFMVY
jgi:hypothetical protein